VLIDMFTDDCSSC